VFAEIVLPIAIDRPLTYGVPVDFQDDIKIGMRVEVGFGKNKIYTGIVWALNDKKDASDYFIKPILSLIDQVPILTELQIKFWIWLATYYSSSLGEVMNASLPNHMKLSSETIIAIHPEIESDEFLLSDNAFALMERIKISSEISLTEAEKIIGKSVRKVIVELSEFGCIYTYVDAKEKFSPKKENIVVLSDEFDNEEALKLLFNQLEKAPKQLHVLLAYLQLCVGSNKVAQSELIQVANANSAQLKALLDKGVLIKDHQIVSRLKIKPGASYEKFLLSNEQKRALQEIQIGFAKNKVALFHGVTGSGKTNVHIEAIKTFLQQEKQVLYLLPEIALTVQIINKLFSEFGDLVHVYHSKFSNHERVETWQAVQSGKPLILVGARSAVLLPFNNLGLIICDEEHDGSYKQQDPSPRYHGRDAAIVLGQLSNAKILLSSATPSVESIHNVQLKKYYYVALKERFGAGKLPEIVVVDAKEVPGSKIYSKVITNQLVDEMKATLEQNKQVILFQNRRGYAPYLYCADCGWHAHCKSCDAALNFHKATDKLHCHYCGAKHNIVKNCGKCNSAKLYYKNYGTERIEEEVNRIFPTVIVDRLDTDAIKTKNKYATLIEQIEKNKTHILVGTQLVAKGLDFDHVQLVGILNADNLYKSSDYKSTERGFQLLTQVSGRAGRKQSNAKVIIQALETEHALLNFVVNNDYLGFIKQLLKERQEWNYPPFCRLIKITVKHLKKEKAAEITNLIAASIEPWTSVVTLGPTIPVIGRINNWYIEELLLKLPLSPSLIADAKKKLKLLMEQVKAQKGYSGAFISINVDP
jgi:primosomal protein N' (replication factor Y) (superfamily II helicase)